MSIVLELMGQLNIPSLGTLRIRPLFPGLCTYDQRLLFFAPTIISFCSYTKLIRFTHLFYKSNQVLISCVIVCILVISIFYSLPILGNRLILGKWCTFRYMCSMLSSQEGRPKIQAIKLFALLFTSMSRSGDEFISLYVNWRALNLIEILYTPSNRLLRTM